MNIQLSEHFTYKKLIRFTLPTIITSIYGVVDGLFVSNCVGSDSFAAINLIMPVIMITGAIGFMFGTGGSALVSKILGEGDKEQANKIFSLLIYLLIGIGIILSIIGMIFIKPIASMLGAEGYLLNECVTYGKTLLIALVPFFLQNCFQSFLVVAEKPQMGLKISICAGVVNMVLDFLFVYAFKMGVFGAAIATGISQFVGAIIPFVYFIRKNDTPLRLIKTQFDGKAILKVCTNGSSEMLTNISLSLVNMLYNMQLMKFAGADGISAYGVIMYTGFLFTGIYIGYSIGTAPIIGYHYGANNTDELKNLLKCSLKMIGIVSVVLTILAEITARPISYIFVSYDSNLIEITVNAIRVYSIAYLLSGFNSFISAFFTALNDGVVSAIISFLRTLVFQTISILVLPTIFGLNGIWVALFIAEILSLIVSLIFLIHNRKKYQYA